MAKQRVNSKDNNGGWRGFVDVRIPQGMEWEEVAAECPTGGVLAILQELVGAKLKVSCSYSASNDAFICSLTGTKEGGDNAGYTMTTWSGKLERAICGAWFKHFVVKGGGAWGSASQSSMLEL